MRHTHDIKYVLITKCSPPQYDVFACFFENTEASSIFVLDVLQKRHQNCENHQRSTKSNVLIFRTIKISYYIITLYFKPCRNYWITKSYYLEMVLCTVWNGLGAIAFWKGSSCFIGPAKPCHRPIKTQDKKALNTVNIDNCKPSSWAKQVDNKQTHSNRPSCLLIKVFHDLDH